MKLALRSIYIFTLGIFLLGCGGGDDIEVDDTTQDDNDVNNVDVDIEQSMNTAIGGKMFSIPSPIQMVNMIKDNVETFNEEMLTDPEGVANFTTEYKRAINMGVYGADLGYATIYENNTKAVSYLSSIEKLSDELGIAGAFDNELLERFIDNGNNQDSMLVIMSEGYREGDKFLKDNEEHDVATLILTGGWIEAMYFASVSYENTKSQDIANRIGEQKTALGTIVDLLEEYNTEEMYTDLINDLKSLEEDFEKIEFNYTYVEPITDAKNNQTTIKSKSSVKIEGDVLSGIIEKVKNIRNGLIG
ncbi:hypothetical protein K6119_04735 [Paracrocinitomix mangrovi]|uniref:hypothetical protein n=1 Tax=Paracrocinitomix mangrovi TaxID=2862509 RepID=UPI001C8DA995|nr:hypothetical protein [Paracrocinitomix mangrovi]UKN02822.1 hypothetical protein K6119_04735 [Paracrocinitomix mangrovi]